MPADTQKSVRVNINVTVNEAKRALSGIAKSTEQSTKQFEKFGKAGSKAADDMVKSTDKATQSTNKFFDTTTRGVIKGIASYDLLKTGIRAVSSVWGDFQGALQAQSLETAFERMADSAGYNSDRLIKSLTDASKSTVATSDLMLSANRAMALGVGNNMEDITTLMEIARAKGQAMGLTTTQAFDNIVTGIGRASPLILDNLGITIKQAEAQDLYAKKLGKSAEELTEAEKKQALFNAVITSGKRELKEFGDIALTPAERMQQLQARFKNVREELFQKLIPVFVKVSERLLQLADYLEKNGETVEEFARTIIGLVVAIKGLSIMSKIPGMTTSISLAMKATTASTVGLTGAFKALWAVIRANPLGLLAAGASFVITKAIKLSNELKEATKSLAEFQMQQNDQITDMIINYNKLNKGQEIAADSLDFLKDGTSATSEQMDILRRVTDAYAKQQNKATETVVEATEASDEYKKMVESLNNAYDSVIAKQNEFSFKSEEDLTRFVDLLSDTKMEHEKWSKSVTQGFESFSSGIEKISSDIDSMNDKISSAWKSLDDFISGARTSAAGSFAQIVFDAERAVAELPAKIAEAQADERDTSELQKQLEEAQSVLATAQQEEYQKNEQFLDDLAFLREQANRNELEQATAVLERKIEQKRKETEETVAEIQKQIDAAEDQKNAFLNAQKAMTTAFAENIKLREKGANSEIKSLSELKETIDAVAASYRNMASAASSRGGISGARADGGPVDGGKTYLVGENGPELFTPNIGGVISPNSEVTARAGSTVININNPTVRSNSDLNDIVRVVEEALDRRDELARLGSYR